MGKNRHTEEIKKKSDFTVFGFTPYKIQGKKKCPHCLEKNCACKVCKKCGKRIDNCKCCNNCNKKICICCDGCGYPECKCRKSFDSYDST